MSDFDNKNLLRSTEIRELAFGTMCTLEYRLFYDRDGVNCTLSTDIILSDTSKLGKFILLNPWFCQHVIFSLKILEVVHNVIIDEFYLCEQGVHTARLAGVHFRQLDTLTACTIIEESRIAVNSYTGEYNSELYTLFSDRLPYSYK